MIRENVTKLKRLLNNSTDIVSFNLSKFQSFKVKLPPQHLIEKFNQICSPIFELQKNNEQIITKCLRLQKCIIETLN
ncbi:hypothetical protein OVS_04105 [Mycoplasma ovis str. Michigan]|uniref:Type I restriction modification DNA specificity domain-containing protein n=1 Tax=Mycoplasma ovis str. Michigan TaxID=1415773 RepID=A0ABN4BLD3_9MOLU|nr:hypothetical protein OVS_04105 [Mycoplasma ovis str. Michigan]